MLKFIKLINGEEIVAKVDVGEDGEEGWSEKLELHVPFRNLMLQNGGSALVPYPCAVISVNKAHVLFMGAPDASLEEAYCDSAGDLKIARPGIQLPSIRHS